MAACGRGDGACYVIHSDNARRRHYIRRHQARIQSRPRWAVPLQSQPRLPLSGDDLRRDSHSSERFVGHPFLAVAAGCDPAGANRARGTLSGTYLRRGVPGLQAQGSLLGVATWVSENSVNAMFAELYSLLKKSLWDQSVVQNSIQTLRYQYQNTAMAEFLSL